MGRIEAERPQFREQKPASAWRSFIWSGTLTATEVQTYASETLSGNEPGLVAAWPLDDGSGSARDVGPQRPGLMVPGWARWERTAL